jgi:hypothetical protein
MEGDKEHVDTEMKDDMGEDTSSSSSSSGEDEEDNDVDQKDMEVIMSLEASLSSNPNLYDSHVQVNTECSGLKVFVALPADASCTFGLSF